MRKAPYGVKSAWNNRKLWRESLEVGCDNSAATYRLPLSEESYSIEELV